MARAARSSSYLIEAIRRRHIPRLADQINAEFAAQRGGNFPAKRFSTHSESSSLGGESFGIVEPSKIAEKRLRAAA
jgi:hypothetical protein